MTNVAPSVRLDGNLLLRTLVLLLLLCWPLAVFGGPGYFGDSPAYANGGGQAVAFVEEKLRDLASAAGAAAPSADAPASAEPKGARSIVYSVASFVLHGPGVSMGYLALFQSLALAWTIAVAAAAFGAGSGWRFGVVAAIVTFATPAAVFSNFIMPDIFAGLLMAGMATMATRLPRLSMGVRILLVLLIAFSVASHASHPPLALGLLLVAGPLLWMLAETRGRWMSTTAWLAAPVLLGIVATAATNFIGFGDASLAAKRYPLALARSIEDGPAKWYLEEECAKAPRYAICEVYPDGLPSRVPDLLWPPNGLVGKATAEQMDRIRDQEQEIVLAAAKRYPSVQADRTASNILSQMIRIGVKDVRVDARMEPSPPKVAELGSREPRMLWLRDWIDRISLATAAASLVAAALFWRRIPASGRTAFALVLLGLAGNAVICAVFSGVDERYQARVIWVLPMLVASLILAGRSGGGASTAKEG